MYGRVTALTALVLGDELAADVLAGATTITVDDIADFDEDGGWARVGGESGELVEYATADDETGILALVDPIVGAYSEGDRVDVWDPTISGDGAVAIDYEADLSPDDDITGDPLQASVHHSLVPLLETGIREKGSEAVQLAWDGDDLHVVNVLGKLAEVESGYMGAPLVTAFRATDGTVPNASWTTLSWTVDDLGASPFTGRARVSKVGGGVPGATLVTTFTITEPGVYDMRATARFEDDTTDTGKRGLRFLLVTAADGSHTVGQMTIPAEGQTSLTIAGPHKFLNLGDTVSVQGWQSSGGALALHGAPTGKWYTTFTMRREAG